MTFALVLATFGLLFATAFFVMAEYALVGSRRSRIEAAAKKGDKQSEAVIRALDHINLYVALNQICITAIGLILGTFEHSMSDELRALFPSYVPASVVSALSLLLLTFGLVVFGELVPKYLALSYPESLARVVVRPLGILVIILKPFIWVFEKSGQLVLNLLAKMGLGEKPEDPSLVRDELFFMLRSGEESGGLQEDHSDMVAKTLRLDKLDSEDAMIHRLDIRWLPVEATKEQCLERLCDIPHARIPVCNDDIDDVVGIVYLQDIVKALASNEPFDLAAMAREPIFVPENLTLDRLVNLMREMKTQIVIVQDEYGGTSGLVTLEDVVEEIFGDLEDALEGERPAIEQTSPHRVSVRPDVRYDELMDFLDMDPPSDLSYTTEPLVGVMIEELGHAPKMGDSIELPFGRLRVEAVAKQRVTRIGVYVRQRILSDADSV